VLAALPFSLQFISKPVSRYGNQYVLQWTVTSYPPLVDFALYVRQVLVKSHSLLEWYWSGGRFIETQVLHAVDIHTPLTSTSLSGTGKGGVCSLVSGGR